MIRIKSTENFLSFILEEGENDFARLQSMLLLFLFFYHPVKWVLREEVKMEKPNFTHFSFICFEATKKIISKYTLKAASSWWWSRSFKRSEYRDEEWMRKMMEPPTTQSNVRWWFQDTTTLMIFTWMWKCNWKKFVKWKSRAWTA